jgi:hypothetical protein
VKGLQGGGVDLFHRAADDGGLQQDADLQKFRNGARVELHPEFERFQHGVEVEFAHRKPCAVLDIHDPQRLQGLDRLTHRAAPHTEVIRQLPFRGKRVAWLQVVFDDVLLDMIADRLVKRFSAQIHFHFHAPGC